MSSAIITAVVLLLTVFAQGTWYKRFYLSNIISGINHCITELTAFDEKKFLVRAYFYKENLKLWASLLYNDLACIKAELKYICNC